MFLIYGSSASVWWVFRLQSPELSNKVYKLQSLELRLVSLSSVVPCAKTEAGLYVVELYAQTGRSF